MFDPAAILPRRTLRTLPSLLAIALATGAAPTPVAVVAGRADFDLEARPPGSKTLVIVSALATGAGPFAMTLKATPKAEGAGRPLATTVDPPAHVPMAVALPPPSAPRPSSATPPTSRRFHVLVRDGDVASASNYLAVEARLAALGERVQVYVDARDQSAVDPATLRQPSTWQPAPLPQSRLRAALRPCWAPALRC